MPELNLLFPLSRWCVQSKETALEGVLGNKGKRCLFQKFSRMTLFYAIFLLELNFLELRYYCQKAPVELQVSTVPQQGRLWGGRALRIPGCSVHVRVWPLARPARRIGDLALTWKLEPSCLLLLDFVMLWFFSECSSLQTPFIFWKNSRRSSLDGLRLYPFIINFYF